MKPMDVELGRIQIGSFSHLSDQISQEDIGKLVSIKIDNSFHEVLLYLEDNRNTLIKPINNNSRNLLDEISKFPLSNFSRLISVKDKVIIIETLVFSNIIFIPKESSLNIQITDLVIDKIPYPYENNIVSFFTNEFLLDDMAFVMGGKEDFSFIGKEWICSISKDISEIFKVRDIKRIRKRQYRDKPVTLLKGTICFSECLFKSYIANFVKESLNNLLEKPESYLANWEIYNKMEEELMWREMIEFGKFEYSSFEDVVINDEIQYIFNLKNCFSPKRSEVLNMDSVKYIIEDEIDKPVVEKPIFVGEFISSESRGKKIYTRIDIERAQEQPHSSGYLVASFRGDEIRIKRRNIALERIKTGDCELSTLGLILEGDSIPFKESRHIRVISRTTKRAFGNNRPTKSQEEALDIALNTPDIALIQGPPGTGKTSVIRALIARLSEISEKRGRQAKILVTSYQHDAVDNAIEAVDAGGLPIYRFGGKFNDKKSSEDLALLKWIDERKTNCSENLKKLGEPSIRKILRDVNLLKFHWSKARGTDKSILILLQDIEKIAYPYLDEETRDDLSKLKIQLCSIEKEKVFEQVNSKALSEFKNLVESQRIDKTSFLDDGIFQAKRLVKFLKGRGSNLNVCIPESLLFIAEIAETTELKELPTFFDTFRKDLKLLNTCSYYNEVNSFNGQSLPEIIESVFKKILKTLHEKCNVGNDGIVETIEEFMEEIENLEAVKSMIKKYSSIVAGTCQQVVSSTMGMGWSTYDVVIVDEAARANPLDLIIPMSLGKQIILVGDHKQLPHILEPEIVYEFTEKYGDPGKNLKESVFERLFRKFIEEKKKGGPKRTVTLLDDFRMHPTISNYISEAFYDGQVKTKLNKEERQINLGLYDNKPVSWIDVPKFHGLEQRDNNSIYREAEVRIIIEEVRKVLEKDDQCSIGIITFYSKQANDILKKIEEIPDIWQNRILAGTVDAFQGREFDIVFLSAVRCNNYTGDILKRVGFLSFTNRLCVALSRAKKMLIIVGDSETLTNNSRETIKELKFFCELCRSSEGFYERR